MKKGKQKKQDTKETYYSDQLNKLNPLHTITVQFKDEETKTNWLSLNVESIEDIQAFLIAYKAIL